MAERTIRLTWPTTGPVSRGGRCNPDTGACKAYSSPRSRICTGWRLPSWGPEDRCRGPRHRPGRELPHRARPHGRDVRAGAERAAPARRAHPVIGEAPEGFDARRSARERTYRYYLYPARIGLPHLRHYCWRIQRRPECAALNSIAAPSRGAGFRRLRRDRGSEKTTMRSVNSARFSDREEFLVFEIRANAFLRKMVRSVLARSWLSRGGARAPRRCVTSS